MAGGWATYLSSSYTLYTPYTTSKMQRFIESQVNFAPEFSTGFGLWNSDTQAMEAYNNQRLKPSLYLYNVVNGELVKPQQLTAAFDNYDSVYIKSRDGRWTSHIYLPTATATNTNKVVIVERNSAYNVGVATQPSYTETGEILSEGPINWLNRNKIVAYRSNGSQWLEINANGLKEEVHNPTAIGVPVTTLVGYYDPQKQLQSYLYPAMHGSYGYVYPADNNVPNDVETCALNVTYQDGQQSSHRLYASRYDSGVMNKFHVNVKTEDQPRQANVVCGGDVLASLAIQGPINELKTSVNGAALPLPELHIEQHIGETFIPIEPTDVVSFTRKMTPFTVSPTDAALKQARSSARQFAVEQGHAAHNCAEHQ